MKRFILSDITKTFFYGVIIVLGSPVILETSDARQAIIHSESELQTAKEVLEKAGKTHIRVNSVKARQLVRFMDMTP